MRHGQWPCGIVCEVMKNMMAFFLWVALNGWIPGHDRCIASEDNRDRTLVQEHLEISNRIIAGEYDGALERLERLVLLEIADGKTYALLALVYNQLGACEDALYASEEALSRGEDSSVLRRERGKALGCIREYNRRVREEIRRAEPSDPRSLSLREEWSSKAGGTSTRVGSERRRRLSLDLCAWGEIVDAPVASKRGWPSPGEISDKKDETVNFSLDASYAFKDPNLPLEYGPSLSFYRNFYDDLSAFDYTYFQAGLFTKTRLAGWIFDATMDAGYTWLGEKGYRKCIAPGLGITYVYANRRDLSQFTKLSWDATYMDDVSNPPRPEENRSGWYPALILKHTVHMNRTGTTTGVKGYWQNHSSLGSSYVGDLLGLRAFLGQELPLDFSSHISVGFEGDWFEDSHVSAQTGDVRKQGHFIFDVGLDREVVQGVFFFLGYAHKEVNSNLDRLFSYQQNVFFAGVHLSH